MLQIAGGARSPVSDEICEKICMVPKKVQLGLLHSNIERPSPGGMPDEWGWKVAEDLAKFCLQHSLAADDRCDFDLVQLNLKHRIVPRRICDHGSCVSDGRLGAELNIQPTIQSFRAAFMPMRVCPAIVLPVLGSLAGRDAYSDGISELQKELEDGMQSLIARLETLGRLKLEESGWEESLLKCSSVREIADKGGGDDKRRGRSV